MRIPLALAFAMLFVTGCSGGRFTGGQYYDGALELDRVIEECPGLTEHANAVDTFLVIGHRGAAAREVENTIPSMRAAVEEDSANAVEIDLVFTADGQVALWHDWDPNSPISLVREGGLEPSVKYRPVYPDARTGMRKPANELTLAQLRTHYGYALKDTAGSDARVDATIPTFEEFVRWAAARPRLRYVFLDIKAPGSDTATAHRMIMAMEKTLASISHRFRPVYLTPAQEVYDVIASHIDGANLSFDLDLPGGAVTDPCGINSASVAFNRGKGFASTVHPFASTLLPWTTLKRLLACDVRLRDSVAADGTRSPIEKVIAATINEVEKMECLIGIGVDGLITDDPKKLRQLARRLGKRVD
ncbi:MAG TPA: glycerophosphodiester phosphodiesterase [Candidatus Kapabacteria bacterium]|nr:glycerophosphodiester phosphodiesterase [Candidatus Kapabacteria bacterium]